MKIRGLDFSKYHPLDHWPYSARCRQFYGGGKRHLGLTWEHRRKPQIIGIPYRLLLCRLDRHRFQVWYKEVSSGRIIAYPVCEYCPARRRPSTAEIKDIPPIF